VTPGYFATLQMRLTMGRDFTAADAAGAPPVVIINETMARTFWPRESPVGQRIGDLEIVGVVNDVRFATDPSEPSTRFQSYVPFAQDPRGFPSFVLRGSISVETLRRAVAELDADLPLNDAGPARAVIDRSLASFGVAGWLLSSFGGLGLLLASLGIYGVMAGFVVQRTNEIGVRMALGAPIGDVLWLVVGKGLRLTLLGVAIGLIGAIGVERLLASIAPGVRSGDPLAIVLVTALLVGVALLASWLPARRAARVDPMTALRCE
jgi:putative ABC transport system permease protein